MGNAESSTASAAYQPSFMEQHVRSAGAMQSPERPTRMHSKPTVPADSYLITQAKRAQNNFSSPQGARLGGKRGEGASSSGDSWLMEHVRNVSGLISDADVHAPRRAPPAERPTMPADSWLIAQAKAWGMLRPPDVRTMPGNQPAAALASTRPDELLVASASLYLRPRSPGDVSGRSQSPQATSPSARRVPSSWDLGPPQVPPPPPSDATISAAAAGLPVIAAAKAPPGLRYPRREHAHVGTILKQDKERTESDRSGSQSSVGPIDVVDADEAEGFATDKEDADVEVDEELDGATAPVWAFAAAAQKSDRGNGGGGGGGAPTISALSSSRSNGSGVGKPRVPSPTPSSVGSARSFARDAFLERLKGMQALASSTLASAASSAQAALSGAPPPPPAAEASAPKKFPWLGASRGYSSTTNVYKLGRYDKMTTNLYGVAPEVVKSSTSVYQGIDAELEA